MHDQPSGRARLGATSSSVRAYGTMNTLRALEHLALAAHSAPELAAALRIGDDAARRILARFGVEGYAVQEGGHRRRHRATLRLAALGRRVLEHSALPRVAAPRVMLLAATSGCPTSLWIPADDAVVCVLQAGGAPVLDAPDPMLGRLLPATDHAAGRVLTGSVIDEEDHEVAAVVREDDRVVAALALTVVPASAAALAILREEVADVAAEITHALAGRCRTHA